MVPSAKIRAHLLRGYTFSYMKWEEAMSTVGNADTLLEFFPESFLPKMYSAMQTLKSDSIEICVNTLSPK